jgi:hypothetical protein
VSFVPELILRVAGCAAIYDVCQNDCVLFAKELADSKVCPTCNAERADCKKYRYLPLIPQLQRLYRSKDPRGESACDVTESDAFRSFAGKCTDPRDVLLMLCVDGINPFKALGAYTCWPVLIQLANLSPLLRALPECQLLVGIAPGPKAPRSLNPYLTPLVDELLLLETEGVRTWDAFKQEFFVMRGGLALFVADHQAASKALCLMGNGAARGCLKCTVVGSQK